MDVLSEVRVGRLPAEVAGFVGRRAELAEVKRLLAGSRLVTLTGVGGSGKTRLALRVATDLRRGFADGVWLVDLASVTDAALIVHEVAATLGLRDQTERPVLEVVVDFLWERRLLLVLDNCEHLLDECAEFVLAALRGAAGLRLLCTSRQPLGVVGEAVWTVPGLAYPEPHGELPADAQVRYPALALFVLRAGAVSPGFALGADSATTVAEICRRLDGLPLAIELAASRLRVLSLQQLAAALRDGYPKLTVRSAAPAWHRTLEAAFEWSYRLCTPAERLAWARASVFAGSFGLAAAERVCAGGALAGGEVLEALVGLVDKSVLIREDHPTGVRYRLLATVREYGLVRLRTDPTTEAEWALRRRHRDWYLELTARFDAEWFGPDQVAWGQRLQVELPDLRAALDFCLNTEGQTQAGLNLAANLAIYWHVSGQVREADLWYRRALAADRRPTKARLRALSGYCDILKTFTGDEVVTRARECIELARQLGDADAAARSTRDLANGLLLGGNLTEARLLAEDALAYFAARQTADFDVAYAQLLLALAMLYQGHPADAAPLLANCRDICRRHGDQWWLGHVLIASALVALALGDVAQADGYVRESLPPRHARGDTPGIAASLERLAWIAALTGDFERAARLLGAANQQWHLIGQTLYGAPLWQAGRHDCETRTRTALGDRAYDKAVRHGAALTLDQAVRYALGKPEPPAGTGKGTAGRTTAGPEPATPLTPREREVAQLVAQGLSNKQIATRLVVSQRTAESHVENILRKLGFTTRTQIVTWAAITHHDNH